MPAPVKKDEKNTLNKILPKENKKIAISKKLLDSKKPVSSKKTPVNKKAVPTLKTPLIVQDLATGNLTTHSKKLLKGVQKDVPNVNPPIVPFKDALPEKEIKQRKPRKKSVSSEVTKKEEAPINKKKRAYTKKSPANSKVLSINPIKEKTAPISKETNNKSVSQINDKGVQKPNLVKVSSAVSHKYLKEALTRMEKLGTEVGVAQKKMEAFSKEMEEKLSKFKSPDVFLDANSGVTKHMLKFFENLKQEALPETKVAVTEEKNIPAVRKQAIKSPFIQKGAPSLIKALTRKDILLLPEIYNYIPNKINTNNPLLSEFSLPITDSYVEEIKQLYNFFDIVPARGEMEDFEYIHDLVIKHKQSILSYAPEFEYFMLFQNSVKRALLSFDNDVKTKRISYPQLSLKYNFKIFVSCIKDNTKSLNNNSIISMQAAYHYPEMLGLKELLTPANNEEEGDILGNQTTFIYNFKVYFRQCINYLYYLELHQL